MSYLGVKFNNTIRKIAGMAIMDVAFSNTSINGVQNKIIKAKFDEVESELSNKIGSIDIVANSFRSGSWAGADGIAVNRGIFSIDIKSDNGTSVDLTINNIVVASVTSTTNVHFNFITDNSTLIGSTAHSVVGWTWTPLT